MSPKVSITLVRPTRAESDEALLKSWLRSLNSAHTQRNFETTALRFLAGQPEGGLRAATVEDVRDTLTNMSADLSEASARQYVLRIKLLLGYAHALGFTPFNAGHLTERAVNGMVKRTARKAGINEAVSPHWLRHAHGSHAIDRGASLPEVQSTLGHGNIATTSGYLHARPNPSSGLHLDPGVFLR